MQERVKPILNIATGLIGKFVSRNNDFQGYWALGFLCATALNSRDQIVSLNLLNIDNCPPCSAQAAVEKQFFDHLRRMCSAQNVDWQKLKTAFVHVQFWWQSDKCPEYKFTATIVIVDSQGKGYSASGHGKCSLHDPSKFLRSNRALHCFQNP